MKKNAILMIDFAIQAERQEGKTPGEAIFEASLLYGRHGEPDFDRLQEFYRLFRGPGVAHCAGGAGPHPRTSSGRW